MNRISYDARISNGKACDLIGVKNTLNKCVCLEARE